MAPQPHVVQLFREVIWHSLDNGLESNASFVAERLLAYDNKDPDAKHLLALSYLRSGKTQQAMAVTENVRHAGCAYIYAQCCLQVGKYSEGIVALEDLGSQWVSSFTLGDHSDSSRRHMPDAGAVYCLIGHLAKKCMMMKKAVNSYVSAVKINPFLWEAFDGLCQLGINVRVDNIFKATSQMIAARDKKQADVPQNAAPVTTTATTTKGSIFTSRLATVETPDLFAEGPVQQPKQFDFRALDPRPNFLSRLQESDTPGTPTFGASTSDEDESFIGLGASKPTSSTLKPAQPRVKSSLPSDMPRARAMGRPTTRELEATIMKRTTSDIPTRRSTRLASSGASVTRPTKPALVGRKVPAAKGRSKSTYSDETPTAGGLGSHDTSLGSTLLPQRKLAQPMAAPPGPPAFPSTARREEAESCVLKLFAQLAAAVYALSKYECGKAIDLFRQLPPEQYESAYVLSKVGRAQFESVKYEEAEKVFRRLRELHPMRLEDMEIYSTILWHLRKDVQLSYLAHELLDIDRLSPQAWCAVGNCFSLQREHDQAIKCLQRAVQLDSEFAYAHTLEGHEHVANEEWDKAQLSFRTAIRLDRRHYNAWYGIGMVYNKIGKSDLAEQHFRRAAEINPSNVVLICCIGMVLEKHKRFQEALVQYNRACQISPSSAMARFKKARILMMQGEYMLALRELQALKDIAPDEGNVHFLLGQIYKHINDRPAAMRHFTIALNLDPKAAHLIKEEIASRAQYDGEEEDEDMGSGMHGA
ncbi:anaphase-promoting complex subunit cdc27 [Saitoella coloradoensis]